MAIVKKNLTLREKNLKELISCNKKIEKLKTNLLNDLVVTQTELYKLFEDSLEDFSKGFDMLIDIAKHSNYKDQEKDEDYELDE